MTYITERIIYKYIYINIIEYIHVGMGLSAHCQPPPQVAASLSWPGKGAGMERWGGLQAVFNGTKQNVVASSDYECLLWGMEETGPLGGEGKEENVMLESGHN